MTNSNFLIVYGVGHQWPAEAMAEQLDELFLN